VGIQASEFIVKLRKYWIQRVVSASRDDAYNRRIPTLSVAGIEDNFVPKKSVTSFFVRSAITDGNHLTMVKPHDPSHLSFQIVRKELSSPRSPKQRFTESVNIQLISDEIFEIRIESPPLGADYNLAKVKQEMINRGASNYGDRSHITTQRSSTEQKKGRRGQF
jgi:hypothetical protein